MIKIYVQNKPLFLIDYINSEVEDYLHRQDTIFIDELNVSAVKTMLHELEQPHIYTGVFLHPKLEEAVASFKAQLNNIIASGGLVHTDQNEVLLIFRKGKWDLPKGKLDEGESLEACALREIEEETGVKNLTIEQPLQVTYHTYREKGQHILKESHWYLLRAAEKSTLKPQTEEDIDQCIWVPMEEVSGYIGRAFASVADVLKEGLKILQPQVK